MIGVIREPLDPKADTGAPEFKSVRTVVDRAISDMRRLGAVIIDAPPIRDLAGRSARLYDDNVFETEAATNTYLAQHANAPVKTLAEILLSGKVVPARARVLMNVLGHSTDESGYLQLLLAREQLRQAVLVAMADQQLDALAYATFDYPAPKIPADALTRVTIDSTGPGNQPSSESRFGIPCDHRASRIHGRGSACRARVDGARVCRTGPVQVGVCIRAGQSASATAGLDAGAAK